MLIRPQRQPASAQFVQSSELGSARKRAARLLDRGIFFALLALVALTAVPYGTVEQWWMAIFECAAFALGLLGVMEGLLSGSLRINQPRLLIPLLVLALYAFLQTLPFGRVPVSGSQEAARRTLSVDPYGTRLFVYHLLALTVVLGLMLRHTSSPRRLRMLIHFVIAVGVASAVFGLFRQTMQHEAGFLLPYLPPGRGYGQFINRNHFAFLMEMVLGLALGLVAGGGVPRIKALIYLGFAVLAGAALILSNSRGGILGMFCQLIFMTMLYRYARCPSGDTGHRGSTREWWRVGRLVALRIILIAGLAVAVAISIVWVGGEPVVSHFETVPYEFTGEGASGRANASRRGIWGATWKLIKANPLTGVGFGGYRTAVSTYYDASGISVPREAHNDYLDVPAGGGLVGTLLVAWFVAVFVRSARDQLRSPDPFRRAACFGALAGIVAVAVHSFVDFGLHITANTLIFSFLVVIATADGRVEEEGAGGGHAGAGPPFTLPQ